MSHSVGEAWAYYREHGLGALMARVHRRTSFVLFTKALKETRPESQYADVAFRIASHADVPLAAALHARYKRCQAPHDLAERIEAGELAVLGVAPADPSNVVYVSVASRNNRFFRLLPPDLVGLHDSCSHGIWVPNTQRGKGIARRGVEFMEYAAHRAGSPRLWAFVKADNKASIALHRALGYEQYGLFRAGRWFGKRVAALRPAAHRRWQPLPVPEPGRKAQTPNAPGLPEG